METERKANMKDVVASILRWAVHFLIVPTYKILNAKP